MVFNSFEFLIFFSITYLIYLALQNNLKLQNRMLLLASCIFYGWWDWRFLLLMWGTILVDYYMGLKIHQTEDPARRKQLLAVSIIANMSVLGFFKYFNFFQANVIAALNVFGISVQPHLLNVLLPIGVSFYTFQSMSYTIDIYRKELIPAHNVLDFAVFVTYFPHLVAGPILRATKLLPQVLSKRVIDRANVYEGFYLIFWGLFKKIFVADNLAKIAERVFNAPPPYDGFQALIGIYAFAFQIYSDFSAYSDMARGLGKCMGFDIMTNFNLPYFSANPQEFWSRWHISLSTWLRDYVYIPLGGNRRGPARTYINLGLTMLLGGIWHGANWTFVVWGAYHGLLLILYRYWQNKHPEQNQVELNSPFNFVKALKIIFFFHLICVGWVFFRANSVSQAIAILQAIFSVGFAGYPVKTVVCELGRLAFYAGPLLCVQLVQYFKKDLLVVFKSPVMIKIAFYLLCFYLVNLYGALGGKEFIYFQF